MLPHTTLLSATKQGSGGKVAPFAQACSWIIRRKRVLSPIWAQDIILGARQSTPAQPRQPHRIHKHKEHAFRVMSTCPGSTNFVRSHTCVP